METEVVAMGATHLSRFERYQLEYGLRIGRPKRVIAADLGRSPSTIAREVRRGSVMRETSDGSMALVYRAEDAQRLANERKARAHVRVSKPERDRGDSSIQSFEELLMWAINH